MDFDEHAASKRQRIWQVISTIPAGKVASFGQVAVQAGLPNAARMVGNTLRQLPAESKLPWHRVINAQGKISLPPNSAAYHLQRQRLIAEGIIFSRDKIAPQYFYWR